MDVSGPALILAVSTFYWRVLRFYSTDPFSSGHGCTLVQISTNATMPEIRGPICCDTVSFSAAPGKKRYQQANESIYIIINHACVRLQTLLVTFGDNWCTEKVISKKRLCSAANATELAGALKKRIFPRLLRCIPHMHQFRGHNKTTKGLPFYLWKNCSMLMLLSEEKNPAISWTTMNKRNEVCFVWQTLEASDWCPRKLLANSVHNIWSSYRRQHCSEQESRCHIDDISLFCLVFLSLTGKFWLISWCHEKGCRHFVPCHSPFLVHMIPENDYLLNNLCP